MFLPMFVSMPTLNLGLQHDIIIVLKRLLNEVLRLNQPLTLNKTYDEATKKALDEFKRNYSKKYNYQFVNNLLTEELFIALGKELKEINEGRFQALLRELDNLQWTNVLSGKIYEVRAFGIKIDAALTELFTKTGIVEGTNAVRSVGNYGDNHFYLNDGQLHTIHIYGNQARTEYTGVFIPKEFSEIKYVGGRMASVVCKNPKSGNVIRASHILITQEIQFHKNGIPKDQLSPQNMTKIQIQLTKNLMIVNSKGSRYIGDIGGPQVMLKDIIMPI